MMIMTLRATFAPGKKVDAIKVLDSIVGPTTAQPDCLSCTLYSNVNNDDDLFFLQEWGSREALARHIRSNEFRKILAAMEMANERPEISFIKDFTRSGLELVEKIRGN